MLPKAKRASPALTGAADGSADALGGTDDGAFALMPFMQAETANPAPTMIARRIARLPVPDMASSCRPRHLV